MPRGRPAASANGLGGRDIFVCREVVHNARAESENFPAMFALEIETRPRSCTRRKMSASRRSNRVGGIDAVRPSEADGAQFDRPKQLEFRLLLDQFRE